MSCGNGSSLFGPSSQYIKTNNGDFIALIGSNTTERLIMSDLRMPYKQILKSRVILKPGQVNYLLNHLGLGDNATFVAMKATYDPKSVIEEDNYIQWNFYTDFSNLNYFAQLLVLTGNSTHRVEQIYLTNPSTKYSVSIDIMVAVIDDNYSFFSDTVNQSGLSFTGLEFTDIQSYVVGESLVIYDKNTPIRPLIYIMLSNINSIEISENILIIDDSGYGNIFLSFLTEYDAIQANSLLNYVLSNPSVDISNISPIEDEIDPILYFNSFVGGTGNYISFNGATSGVPYNTSNGFTFSTSISLVTYGTSSVIDRSRLITLLIDHITDNRDGIMSITSSNLILMNTASATVSSITSTGTYSLTFDFSDIAQNYLDGVFIDLTITT